MEASRMARMGGSLCMVFRKYVETGTDRRGIALSKRCTFKCRSILYRYDSRLPSHREKGIRKKLGIGLRNSNNFVLLGTFWSIESKEVAFLFAHKS